MMKVEIDSIDAYSAGLNFEAKAALEQVRLLAAKLIPNCSERMSYGMPSFDSNGIIFWFGVWKTHFGLYPKSKALEVLAPKLKNYKTQNHFTNYLINKKIKKGFYDNIIL